MAEPWFRKYNESYLKTPGQFDAGLYGVVVEAVEGADFEIIGVHHLDQSENNGNHHVYGDVLDQNGLREYGAVVYSKTIGSPSIVKTDTDKPRIEPAFNRPLWQGENVELWVGELAGVPVVSDRVRGIRTDWPDEPPGNTRFHHSFYVVWRARSGAQPVPMPIPVPTPGINVAEALLALQDARQDITVAEQILRGEIV